MHFNRELVERVLRFIARGEGFGSATADDEPPGAPDAPVRQPVRHGPGGRGSAIALDEPDDMPSQVTAIGKLH